jgi:hypothetical protein
MRETRQSGSEGGGAHALPTPILVDYKSRYKRGTCTSRNVIRSLPLPVPYLCDAALSGNTALVPN